MSMAADSVAVTSVPLVSLYDSGEVYAATTFRGLSKADDAYSGFSLCHYVGDEASHWQQCRDELASCLGISADMVVVPRQTHSARVAVVDSVPVDSRDIDGVDAVVTALQGVAVGVNTADCLPLLLCDEKAGVVCAGRCVCRRYTWLYRASYRCVLFRGRRRGGVQVSSGRCGASCR